MVQRLIRADLCDLPHESDEAAVARIGVEIDGVRYEADVCGPHYDDALEDLSSWRDAGRRAASREPQGGARTVVHRRAADAIRQWARKQDEFADIADLGRLPRAVVEAAHEAGVGLDLARR